MCGICGIWNYSTNAPVDRDLLRRMTDSMHHRGPDDSGLHCDDAHGLGLGFRRLSIIDLSPAGHQPMSNEDGTVWLTFNGEIYNFRALRPHLERQGHVFRSQTDTEVIIHHYEEHGPDGVRDLCGMFGLALWDQRRRRLTLARDRVGKKPLYYYDDGQRLIFASELKAIVIDRTVPRQLNLAAVAEYLSLGYVAAPQSIFAGIAKLPAGHVMVHAGTQPHLWRYWDWLPAFTPDLKRTEAEWITEIQATLREAVRVRMISDVPLGAFLSGGVDSSAVVATMAGLSEQPVKTFAIGFEAQSYNELPYARSVAQHFGTDHHEYIVQPEAAADLLPRLAYQFDEPFGDSSAMPTYYVAKMAHQHVTVCLTGDGGDEAMGGYNRYALQLQVQWVDRIPQALRKAVLNKPLQLLPAHPRVQWVAQWLQLDADERYAFGMQTFTAPQAQALLMPEIAHHVAMPPTALWRVWPRMQHLDCLSRMQYLDSQTYLTEDILVKVDRASMLNSLEVRSPLLDHHFLAVAAHIPAALRFHNGTGKYMFKQALRGLLPDRILERPKMGFGIPGARWLKGDMNALMHEVLGEEQIIRRGLFRPTAVRALLHDNLSVGSSRWPQLWSLLIFELWCQAYLDR